MPEHGVEKLPDKIGYWLGSYLLNTQTTSTYGSDLLILVPVITATAQSTRQHFSMAYEQHWSRTDVHSPMKSLRFPSGLLTTPSKAQIYTMWYPVIRRQINLTLRDHGGSDG